MTKYLILLLFLNTCSLLTENKSSENILLLENNEKSTFKHNYIKTNLARGKSYRIFKNSNLSDDSIFYFLNNLTLHAGDSVLFERGGMWRGQYEIKNSGSENSPIYIGCFGKGKMPIFNGAIIQKNWENIKENVWSIKGNSLEHPFWTVCAFDQQRGTLVSSINALQNNKEYFIDKHLRNVYIYHNKNPNISDVETSIYQHGIFIKKHQHIKIEGIKFQNYGYSGIMIRNEQAYGNIIVDACNFYFNKMDGLVIMDNHNYNLIKNCHSSYNGNGFYSIRAHNNHFVNDTFINNLSYDDIGLFTDGHGVGLFRSGNCVVEKCFSSLNKGGAVGFDPDANKSAGAFNTTIRYNHFKGALNSSACIAIQDVAVNSQVFIYYNLIENDNNIGSKGFAIYSGFAIQGKLFVYNNTIIQNSGSYRTIAFRYSDNVFFKNNLILSPQAKGSVLELMYGGNIESDRNFFYNPSKIPFVKYEDKLFLEIKDWSKYSYQDLNSISKKNKIQLKNSVQKQELPLKNNGVYVGLTKDRYGNNIVNEPDIGCTEQIIKLK